MSTRQSINGHDIIGALEHDANHNGPQGQVEHLQYMMDHQQYLLQEILNVLTGEQRLDVYQAMFGDVEHYSEPGKVFVP